MSGREKEKKEKKKISNKLPLLRNSISMRFVCELILSEDSKKPHRCDRPTDRCYSRNRNRNRTVFSFRIFQIVHRMNIDKRKMTTMWRRRVPPSQLTETHQ